MSDEVMFQEPEVRARQAPAAEGERRPQPGLRRPVGALARGLPDQWYPVLDSASLGNSAVGIKRFGEELALWRDSAGRPQIVQARCAHRGASLSLARVNGDAVSCRYHGWSFDGTGACVDIPTGEGLGDKLPGLMQRARLKAYRAQERAGYIWMFYGDPARVTPLSMVPYELEDPRWVVYRDNNVWKTNWLNILDNIFDPLHALFVHVGVATQLRRAQLSRFEIAADFEEGFHLAKMGVLPDGTVGAESHVEFLLPNQFRIDLADGTPRGVFRVVMIPTPIDEQTTYLPYIQARRVSGLSRLWWHFQWWTKFRKAQDLIKSQDTAILHSLGDIEESRLHENLAHSDVGVIHLRRRLAQALARSQAPGQDAQPPRPKRPAGPYAAWELQP